MAGDHGHHPLRPILRHHPPSLSSGMITRHNGVWSSRRCLAREARLSRPRNHRPPHGKAWGAGLVWLSPPVAFDAFSAGTFSWYASEIMRSEEHTSELQSLRHLVCRLLLEKKKKKEITMMVRVVYEEGR